MKKLFYVLLAVAMVGFSACRQKHTVNFKELQITDSGIECYAYQKGKGSLLIVGQTVNGEQTGSVILPMSYSLMLTADKQVRLTYTAKADEEDGLLSMYISQSIIVDKNFEMATAGITQRIETDEGIHSKSGDRTAILLSDKVALVLESDEKTKDFYYLVIDWREAIKKAPKDEEPATPVNKPGTTTI